jgi:hypothetical protein
MRKRLNHFRTDDGYLSALIGRPQPTVSISEKSKPEMMSFMFDEAFNSDFLRCVSC